MQCRVDGPRTAGQFAGEEGTGRDPIPRGPDATLRSLDFILCITGRHPKVFKNGKTWTKQISFHFLGIFPPHPTIYDIPPENLKVM